MIRRCLITGGNAGLGKAAALALARDGWEVILVARDRGRGEAALADVARIARVAPRLSVVDLTVSDGIERLADDVCRRLDRLDVLLNNAGVITSHAVVTPDGHETQFAVNHLAPFQLTTRLLDLLCASAPARIVNVSSEAHRWANPDYDPRQPPDPYEPRRVYAWTKLANIWFTCVLSTRLDRSRVTVNALHPGMVSTKLLRDGMPYLTKFVTPFIGVSADKGARTSVYLATSPEVADVSGCYFRGCRVVAPSDAARDPNRARRLWMLSEELVG